MSIDLVIRNGTVFDGKGSPPSSQDIAIEDGRIQHIGEIGAVEAPELDVRGAYVSPGFIDIHSHSDHTLLVDPRAMSAVHQGVTLEVIGNCGHGCFPIHHADRAKSAIYGYRDDVPLTWRNAEGYFGRLQQAQPAVNVLSLVPNGHLRLSTVGVREGPVQSRDLKAMTALLEESIDQGAWGFSTGLEYPWEAGASEDELTSLCRATARLSGFYATHTRFRDDGAVEAVEEAIRTAERADIRLQISHLLPRNGLESGRRCIDLVDKASARGLDVAFDMHTRLFGTNYLQNALPPTALAGGTDGLKALLQDHSARESMKSYRSILSAGGDWGRIVLLDNLFWPHYARRDLASIADERGQSPLDAVYDLLLGAIEDPRQLMVIINCNTEEQLREAFSHPLCMPGSDATSLAHNGPLASQVFHGAYTWAAWFYRFMVRDQQALSAEDAIFRMTGLPASRLGLTDRGNLEPGAWADIAIFDPETFCEKGTTFEPNRLAAGMLHVIVNGVVTLRDGQLTGERAGAVLRRR